VIARAAYVPDFDVVLDGRRLPADLRSTITAVRFEEALEGASRVELQFANVGLRLLDRPVFDLDVPLELSLGYRPQALEPVFTGSITGMDPTFPAGGMPALTINAQDATDRLNRSRKDRAFPYYITDGAIAALVAAENGLVPRSDLVAAGVGGLGAFAEQPRYQYKQSDHQLLRQIAAEYGYEIWGDGPFLNIRFLTPGLPTPEIELHWGRSLLDFTPRLTSIGQVAAVRAHIWVEALKTQIGVEVTWDGERLAVRVLPALFGEQEDTIEATLTIPDLPVDSAPDAIKWLIGEMRRRVNGRLTASGSAVGDPRFRAGRVIAVSGVGDRYSGHTYRLTSVAHTLDQGGYRTRFQVRKEVV
jgi:uncharacterized protein